ncbi:ABC transporter permease [Microbacterium sediminicola]|uniref:ABC transporter permease n=1 Tax=Microbacterium sediminicola TaxID=415210 RepID=UPI0031E2B772
MTDSAAARYERLAAEPLEHVARSQGGFWRAVRDIVAERHLLGLLVRRDIKARYKDSALGLVWTLINPLVQLIVYYTVMGQILGAARGIDDFAIYVFSGLTIYALFSEVLSGSTGAIVSNAGLVKKIYVPREVYPLSAVGAGTFTFLVQVGVLIGATLVLARPPITVDILYFFPAVLVVLIYGTAFGLLLAALNVYLRDVQYLTGIVLMLALWASPIVYGWTMVHEVFTRFGWPNWLLEAYTNNPLTLAVLGFHKAFWISGSASDYPEGLGLRMLIAILIGLVLLWICQRVFARLQGNFAQEL